MKPMSIHVNPSISENLQRAPGYRLEDKVTIITGSGNGIGRIMAHQFAKEGARIVIADNDAAGAKQVAAEVARLGGESLAITLDISRPGDAQEMIERTISHFGTVDILVNNAGIALNRPFLETTYQEWELLLDVVLTGTFLCAQSAAKAMVHSGSGVIVNVASISGQRGAQGRTAYGVAKAGVIQLTKVMAVELAGRGVRVNAISPGPVDTKQSRETHTPATRLSYHERMPLGRYGTCEEIAAAALFLASDESSFVHGHVLNVDGGFHAAGLIFNPNE